MEQLKREVIQKTKRRTFTLEERKEILEKTNGKCAHCGKVLTPDVMTVEHIFPIARGGDDREYNLVGLCHMCNETKSNMIYNIRDFYKHIDTKYLNNFEEALDDVIKTAINPRKRIMAEDVRLYRGINPMYMQMIYQTFRRNKNRAMKMMKESSIISKYEIAYEAESEEIFNFLEKLRKKGHFISDMYDNEYKVKELVKYGQVYTFRLPDKSIKGVVGLFNVVRNNEELPFQIQNIADVNEQTLMHVITLYAFEPEFKSAFQLIERDLLNDFITCNLKVAVFTQENELHSLMKYSNKTINMPHRFRGNDGYIQCYTGAGDREMVEKVKALYNEREETLIDEE